MFTVTKT